MKPIYNNVLVTTGRYTAGICKILIAPREWLVNTWIKDFSTNVIINTITLQEGRAWLELELVEDTYDFSEKPKESKAGPYFDMSLDGLINDLDEDTLQILNTYRYHEFVGIILDRKRRQIVSGNKDAGMILRMGRETQNKQGGTNEIPISLTIQNEELCPFYAP